MPSPRLFVIVPVFNQEPYVATCLESVIAQDGFEECEVLVIDDGSTDGSLTICETYAAAHANVRVISTPNAGLGAARNHGLREIPSSALGYVTFLDSDDYWHPGYVKSTIDLMKGTPDVIAGHIEGITATPDWQWLALFRDGTKWLSSIEDSPLLFRDVSCCDKVFNLDLVRRLDLSFVEGRHFEDLWFTPQAVLQASGIVINPGAVYRYRMGESTSIMSGAFARRQNYWDHLAGVEHVLSLRADCPINRRRLLDDLAVFTNQWFIHRAPSVLEGDDLERYCAETTRVFDGIALSDLVRPTTSWPARRAFLAAAEGDIARMRLTAPSLDEAVIQNGSLRYGESFVPADIDTTYVPLNHVFGVQAWLGYFDVDEDGATFFGHVKVPGMAIQVPPVRLRPALRVGNQTFVGRWDRRGDALASSDPTQEWSGFAVRIPGRGAQLPSGRNAVAFVLSGGDSAQEEIVCQVQANGGFLREARLIELGDRNIVPVTDDKNWVELLVGPRHRVFNRSVWRAARARSAMKAGQPFARLKAIAAAMKLAPGRQVWLLAERENTAQDNSAALFRYLRQECRGINAFYIIDADADQRARVADLGHVVDRGSFLHVLLMLRASVLVSGFDIDRYMLPPQWNDELYRRHLAWFLGTPRVFLNHGVSYTDVSQALARRYVGVSIFQTSSPREADYVRDRMGYGDQVIDTGLPRFDLLERRVTHPRHVLFMPTWRSYLSVGEPGSTEHAQFLESEYWRFISAFLESPRLDEVLAEHDLVLEVYPHYEVAPLIESAARTSDHIVVIDQAERSVRDAIAEASLFVTDWTSVFFDAAYAGVPIVHAPFDEEEFLGRHYRRGFFDFETDAFGPVALTPEAVVEAISAYADRDFVREDLYTQRADEFFTIRGHHSERTVEAIQEMLRKRR